MDSAGGLDPQPSDLSTRLDGSCHIGIAKLPTELLYHVIRLAASSDRKTAHTCAYVSKLVCRWTAPDRWRTIICTSGDQLEALWELLELPSTRNAGDFTSFPGRQPGAFVENLLIDTSGSRWTVQQLEQEHSELDPCLEQSCPHLNSLDILTCGDRLHAPHQINDFLRHFHYVSYLALGPSEAMVFRLETVSPIKVLVAATGEINLGHFVDQTGPHLSNDPDDPPHVDDALWRADGTGVWNPSLETFRRRLDSIHIIAVDPRSELSGVTMPMREIEALRSGSFADHQAGGPPPRLNRHDQDEALASKWYIWPAEDRKGERRYIRGSDPLPSWSNDALSASQAASCTDSDGFLHPFDNKYSRISPASWNSFRQGATKIRYDTRRFAFRPCEITASRLRPFFEELTTTGLNLSATNDGTETNATASFTHSGPRHAAPHRGAGHFSKPDRGGQHESGTRTAKQAALNTFGCGKFQTLHLCWDPVPNAIGTSDYAAAGGQRNGSGITSSTSRTGNDADSDWPVERQDIWTNTSSQNNEAQAPPPHTTRSRAAASSATAKARSHDRHATGNDSRSWWIIPSSIEPKSSKSFRADLIDSIRTTIGWTRQDQALLSDTPWLSNASDLSRRMGDQQRLNRLESIVAEMAYQQTNRAAAELSGKPRPVAADDERLAIRMVPPAERLKLGGMYVPYTKAQRVQWFLDNLDTEYA